MVVTQKKNSEKRLILTIQIMNQYTDKAIT